jgi:hypothetical protein
LRHEELLHWSNKSSISFLPMGYLFCCKICSDALEAELGSEL